MIGASFAILLAVSVLLFRKDASNKARPRVSGNLVEVYRTFDLSQAEHLAALLNSEGIQTFLHNRFATTLMPISMRGIQVMADKDKIKECLEIMKAFGFEPEFDADSIKP